MTPEEHESPGGPEAPKSPTGSGGSGDPSGPSIPNGALADDQGDQFVSLYRRFRPGRFGELRGQSHVVRALQSAVRDGHVSHAYLFSGPRGTGKTSTARILAKALNCAQPADGEPCGTCASCLEIARGTSLDVHELDAASNNGVDAMRDLVSHAALGTPGRSKVYIVDEVHMLSTAAANSLLKTLEEPPSHVVFVLATTDPQKVPPTIRSRTQHFEFRLLAADTLVGLLRDIRDEADLGLDDDALAVAVRRGRGSARDALSALDQVAAGGSADDVRPEVGTVIDAVCDEDATAVLVGVGRLHEAGWGTQQLAAELVDDLRQAFLVSMAPELAVAAGEEAANLGSQVERLGLARLVRAIETLGRAQVDMRDAPDPRVVLEVALVRLARPELDDSAAALSDRLARLERALAGGTLAPTTTPPAASGAPVAPTAAPSSSPADPGVKPSLGALRRQRYEASAPPASNPSPASTLSAPTPPVSTGEVSSDPTQTGVPTPTAATSVAAPDRDTLVEAWGDHIQRTLPPRARALYGAGWFVSVDGGTATFALPNPTHREKCAEVRGAVEQAIEAYFATPVRIELVVAPGAEGVPSGGGDGVAGVPTSAASRNAGQRSASSRAAHPGAGHGGPSSAGQPPPATDPDLDDEGFDPDDATEPAAVESLAEERLLQAFPGAQKVVE